ncbi:MAG: hypothetical protein KatS3mg087_1027 [Patescibacteria group bacterium]|nr:MAG: hypothetical protein KatS3mg087_1027 [Patescibacteria group bacterium]
MTALAVTFDDLRRELGRFIGWGRDFSKWTEDQITDANDIIKSAMRRIYWPTDTNLGIVDYQWSFLQSTAIINGKAGIDSYKMPDDFGDVVGKVYFKNQQAYPPLDVITASDMLRLKSRFVINGIPKNVSFTMERTDGTKEQSWVMIVYPTPQADYDFWMRYNISPNYLLDSTRQYPIGGAQFSELFIEAVLAVAEERLLDLPGLHSQRFQLELASAIKRDSRNNVAETFGYVDDLRTEVGGRVRSVPNFRFWPAQVSYGGG